MLHMRSLAAQPQPPPLAFFLAGAAVEPLDELELLLEEVPELLDDVLFLAVEVDLAGVVVLVGAASLSASPVAGALASAVGSGAAVGSGGGSGAGAAIGVELGTGGGGGAASFSVSRKMSTEPSTATTAKMPM